MSAVVAKLRSRFTYRALAWAVATVVAAFLVPQVFASAYDQTVIEIAMVYVIATAGLNVAIGFSGQFQMAQASCMAIGAYTTGILTVNHGFGFGWACLWAMLATLAFGAVIALVSLRTRSHYLLLATFGLQLIAVSVISKLKVTGGVNGTSAAVGLPLGGDPILGNTTDYTIVLIIVAGVGLWLADSIKRSYLGLGFYASRQNERLVLTSGMAPGWFRFIAVLISAAYGGVAGILFGPILSYLVPESFALQLTLLLLLVVVVGGMGSVLGVAFAAVLLTIVNQAAQDSSAAWPLIYGLTIMVILAVAPSGLGGLPRRIRGLMRPRGAAGASAYETPTIAPRDERERTAAPAAEPALTAVDISRSFGGVRALDGVNFNVTHGTIHGLIGPNGSGKTTFFDILCGFLPPTDGHIDAAVPGVARLGAYRRARSGLGRTFQLPNVLVHNTVLDNVLLGIMASMPRRSRLLPVGRGNRTEWEKRANAALEEVGMASMSDRVLGDLPYGSQRIVDLARVLAARPSLVLLDEPGAGMSGAERELIKQIVLSLRDRGTTIVVVEHDMRFIMEICDRITVLATGQVIADGTPAEIGADEEVIAAYLGEAYVAS